MARMVFFKFRHGVGYMENDDKFIRMKQCFERGRYNTPHHITLGLCRWCGYEASNARRIACGTSGSTIPLTAKGNLEAEVEPVQQQLKFE